MRDALDRGFESQRDLGLVELRAARALTHFLELPFGGGAALALIIEGRRDRTGFLGLTSALLVQTSELSVDRGRRAGDDRRESIEHQELPFELLASQGSALTFRDVGLQPSLDLVAAPAQHLTALIEARRLDLEVRAQGGDGAPTLVEPSTCRMR